MGGRGNRTILAVENKNMWYKLSLSVVGVNEIMGYDIIYNNSAPNAKFPLKILVEDGIKLISDSSGKITYIVEYINHEAVFEIDIDNKRGLHGHIVERDGRVSHDPNNEFKVPDKYTDLVNECADHNWKFFQKRPPASRNKNLKEIDIEELLSNRRNGK